MDIRTNYILPQSTGNGPGTRAVVWVQGCSIRCPGCCNLDTWDPATGSLISVDGLISRLNLSSSVQLDGITITGGEPLDQYDAVIELCKKIFPLTSIFLTTGYTFLEIYKAEKFKILKYIDILCTGPFVESRITRNEWRGSDNQIISFLTSRGIELSKMPVVSKEFIIRKNGAEVLKTGFTE